MSEQCRRSFSTMNAFIEEKKKIVAFAVRLIKLGYRK